MGKKIVCLSDTHSFIPVHLIKNLKEADEVWHAGDIGNIQTYDELKNVNSNLKCVFGNIDGSKLRKCCNEIEYFEFGKHRILMIHIAGSFGKYNSRTRNLIQKYQPTLLICGHSHILKVMKDHKNNLLYMNPGAAGKHGFHKYQTAIKFKLDEDRLTDMKIIQLGKRGSVA